MLHKKSVMANGFTSQSYSKYGKYSKLVGGVCAVLDFILRGIAILGECIAIGAGVVLLLCAIVAAAKKWFLPFLKRNSEKKHLCRRKVTEKSAQKSNRSAGGDKPKITSEDRDLLNLICDVVEVSEKSKVK